MFSIRRPADQEIRQILLDQAGAPFSYAEVGMTRGTPPAGYAVDRYRIGLGCGEQVFLRACEALRQWKMFDIGWAEICFPDAAIQTDRLVGVLAHRLGLWSLNLCRIVYVVDEAAPTRRFGFAYGTLHDHVEKGEERFLVEWDSFTNAVSYDIFACSRPRHPLAVCGAPVVRRIQRQFGNSSLAAVQRWVECNPTR